MSQRHSRSFWFQLRSCCRRTSPVRRPELLRDLDVTDAVNVTGCPTLDGEPDVVSPGLRQEARLDLLHQRCGHAPKIVRGHRSRCP